MKATNGDAQRMLDELLASHGPVLRASGTVRGRVARLRREAREDHLESAANWSRFITVCAATLSPSKERRSLWNGLGKP